MQQCYQERIRMQLQRSLVKGVAVTLIGFSVACSLSSTGDRQATLPASAPNDAPQQTFHADFSQASIASAASVDAQLASTDPITTFTFMLDPGRTLSGTLDLTGRSNEVALAVNVYGWHFNSHFDAPAAGAKICNGVCTFPDFTNTTAASIPVVAQYGYKEGGPTTNKGFSGGRFRVKEQVFSPITGKLVSVRLEVVNAERGHETVRATDAPVSETLYLSVR
jgi:hypothetical protein